MKRFFLCAIFFFSFCALFAQKDSASIKDTITKKYYPKVIKPFFGLGVGNFTFFGDVGNNYKGYHPLVSRTGYELKVNYDLTKYLDLGFYVIFGKISANERDGNRNLNFESRIRTGGAILSYNFHQMLPITRKVEPYVFSGFESFEFLSKTDLYDKYGNKYFYWSDGSIRNIDQNATNANQAVMVYRDYKYESDLRGQNIDGFGKYRERSWAIPLGAGITFIISERVKFKIGSSMHFTFTDLVDNVTSQSVGIRKGDSKNDKFLYSSFSLHYDFFGRKDDENIPKNVLEDDDDGPVVRDITDEDKDGIRDFDDYCLHTPAGVRIDAKGCPVDKDKDLVFDYVDDELPTPNGNFVDEKGVTLTDDDFELRYKKYMDSTGQYHGGYQNFEKEIVGDGPPRKIEINAAGNRSNLTYYVILDAEKKQIGANELYKYLSQKDFHQIEIGDTIFYVIGNYSSIADALNAKNSLDKNGLHTNGIGETNNLTNNSHTLNKNEINNRLDKENGKNNPSLLNNNDVVFRVQIGAFDKKLSDNVFKDVPELLPVSTNDGVTRYYSGSFNSIEYAAQRKIDLLEKGFESSFIVAFKNGKRISLKDAGARMVDENSIENLNENGNVTKVDPSKVRFKVQLGAFKNDIPSRTLDVFLQLGNVQPRRTDNGLTIYLHGDFSSLDDATILKNKIVKMGLGDALVVGEYNGHVISAADAASLKNGK